MQHQLARTKDIARPIDHLAGRGAPTAPALIVRDTVIDHADFAGRVGRLAGWLAAQDVGPGDRVASWMPKMVEAALMPLATARAGLVHVPVNPALKPAQVAHILADSGARLLVVQDERAALLSASDRADARVVAVTEMMATASSAIDLPPSDHAPDALAALLYTSGSTGLPKGVMLSHRSLWLGAQSVATYLDLRADERVLAVLPLSFDYGQSQLLSTLHAGGCTIMLDYLTPRDVVRAVARHGVTGLAGVPPLWFQLAEADWGEDGGKSLRFLTNSGGRLPVPLVRRLRERFPDVRLYLMYGLTEAFRSSYLDPALVDERPDSIGKAIPHAELLVVDEKGTDVPPGIPGELVHCGPLVADGYWQDPARTAERFRPAPPQSRYGGMAVWSGDSVVADPEGFLTFVGRADEMIKTSGNRVSPTEIEEAALASGLIAECVALGVADERLGQAILLIASARPGIELAEVERRLRADLRQHLPAFMQPRDLIWRDDLPRNPNGKLDRAALRAELGA